MKRLIYAVALALTIASFSSAAFGYTQVKSRNFPYIAGAGQFPQTKTRLVRSGGSGVNQVRANLSVSQAQKTGLESQVDSEVATAYENVISAQRVLERDRTVLLPQALEVLNLSHESYQYGQTGLSDVLLNQQSVQSVFDNLYADILAYQTALGALEQAVNLPLSAINNTNAPKTP